MTSYPSTCIVCGDPRNGPCPDGSDHTACMDCSTTPERLCLQCWHEWYGPCDICGKDAVVGYGRIVYDDDDHDIGQECERCIARLTVL